MLGVACRGGPAPRSGDTARQFSGCIAAPPTTCCRRWSRVGCLQQDDDTRSYSLTQKLYQLTGRALAAEQIGEIAQPLLEELTQRIGEGSSVAVWRDGLVRIVAKCETDGPVRIVQDVNAQRPFHCTAVGKALAAWMQPLDVAGRARLAPAWSASRQDHRHACGARGRTAPDPQCRLCDRRRGAVRGPALHRDAGLQPTPARSRRRCASSGRSSG